MYGGTNITGYRIHYDTGTKHFTLGVPVPVIKVFFSFFFLFFSPIFHEIIDTMTRKIKSYTHKKQTKKIQKLK